MSQLPTASPPALREAFYALSLEQRVPDAALLDEVVRRYPQYAAELTEFAIALAVDALHDAATESAVSDSDEAPITVTPAVSRAVSRFQNRLHARARRGAPSLEHQSAATPTGALVNPFQALSQNEFRDLASRLGANLVFIMKLRDRHIIPDDIPSDLRRQVAEEIEVPIEVVNAHLAGPQTTTSTGQQFYKADGKPTVTKQQSFAEAVRSSGLSEAQQRRLLNLE